MKKKAIPIAHNQFVKKEDKSQIIYHPCRGMPRSSHGELFEQIAIDQTPVKFRASIMQRLLEDGVVEMVAVPSVHKTKGVLRYVNSFVFRVPIHIHMQWCAWCAENVKDED